MDLGVNLRKYLKARHPENRYSSFDYCFNYFQSFRESGSISALASPANAELSCLQLGFYLASWGMLRGSAELLKKSVKYLFPIIRKVAAAEPSLWELDAHCYDQSNLQPLWKFRDSILQDYPGMSDTLFTKIILGVFGSVPAFDTNFKRGCRSAGIPAKFGQRALIEIRDFYQRKASLVDEYRVPTLDFVTGEHTKRKYTNAKVIDMGFFIEGARLAPRNSAVD